MACGSWFTVARREVELSTSLPRTFSPSSTSSSPATTDVGQQLTSGSASTKEDAANPTKDLVAKKIKLKLTPDQRATLRRWYGVYRWTYNQCVWLCCHSRQVTYQGDYQGEAASPRCQPVRGPRASPPLAAGGAVRHSRRRHHRVCQEPQDGPPSYLPCVCASPRVRMNTMTRHLRRRQNKGHKLVQKLLQISGGNVRVRRRSCSSYQAQGVAGSGKGGSR